MQFYPTGTTQACGPIKAHRIHVMKKQEANHINQCHAPTGDRQKAYLRISNRRMTSRYRCGVTRLR